MHRYDLIVEGKDKEQLRVVLENIRDTIEQALNKLDEEES